MRQKIKNHRKQGSFDKKFDFFPQTLSHIPRWVRFVQKTRAKNSHAWAPLKAWHSEMNALNASQVFIIEISTPLHLLKFPSAKRLRDKVL
jgi:hypothetical protein